MSITETCSCGAQIDVTRGPDAFERGAAGTLVAAFREAHWPCRNNVTRTEGSGYALPIIIGNEVTP